MVSAFDSTWFDLSGRIALVTGGNGGIGLGIARGLAKAGAAVVIAGRNPEKNAFALAALEAMGAKAMAVEYQATDPDSCRALVARAAERWGGLHILVANTGTAVRKPPQDTTLEEWRAIIDTNATSAFVCAQSAYPHMKRAGFGKILCIGSILSHLATPLHAAYGASKGAIVQLTRHLAVAWAKDNIQANAILPGWIDTDLTRRARIEVPGLDQRVTTRTPAGRWGTPDDLAGIAVFLASRASDYVTGTDILVDGGYASAG